MNAKRIVLIGVIAVLAMGIGIAAARSMNKTAAPAPTYYLALGDSLSAGFQTDAIPQDRNCVQTKNDAKGREGYVCLVYKNLLTTHPKMKLDNYGLAASPGEDTCSFQAIKNCLGQTSRHAGDNPPYNVMKVSQLSAALKLIKAHPGQVTVITMDLGGNDMLPLLKVALSGKLQTAAKALPAIETRLAKNYNSIASQLRKADKNADIVFINQYDPLSGIPASTFGPHGKQLLAFATQALTQMNKEVKLAATTNHAKYADVYTAFLGKAPVLTHITDKKDFPNIHATNMGYSLYAQVVGKSL